MENLADKNSYANVVLKTIYERRAVRKYSNKPVGADIINTLLDAARMAPSAMNHQPWHFYVLNKPETISSFSKAIISESKFSMLKAGAKEVVHSILHPGSFHLKDGANFFSAPDPIFHGAPLVIFITSPKKNEWAALDIGMCAQNIMLAAKSLGLDSCPVGLAKFIEETKIYQLLQVPDTEHVNLAIIVGYANEVPELHERKKDNVSFIE
jgi:nitroreductase